MGSHDQALALAAQINKKYGEGAVMLANEMVVPVRFPSGSLTLDVSIGGGWPGNQWIEIYGDENHGKTAVTLKTLAANQQRNPDHQALWVASEHYDLDQATALGVDTSRVFVLSTQDMAFAYDTVLEFLSERAVDMAVIDSYPALIPPEEDIKDMDEYTMAEGAKMTNKFFRKVGKAGLRNPHDPGDRPWLGIFINQGRDKIGGWAPNGQTPETTPGGRGKNFAFYTRLHVKRAEWIEVGSGKNKTKVGQVIRTRAVKNKGGPPQRVASMDFYFTDSPPHFHRGDYDRVKDVLTVSVLYDVVRRGGSWYKFEDEQWNGLPAAVEDLRGRPDLVDKIEAVTREVAGRPEDKRTWTEEDIVSASTARTTVRRRRGGSREGSED